MNSPEQRGAHDRAVRGRCALFLSGRCPAPAGCACLGTPPPLRRPPVSDVFRLRTSDQPAEHTEGAA